MPDCSFLKIPFNSPCLCDMEIATFSFMKMDSLQMTEFNYRIEQLSYMTCFSYRNASFEASIISTNSVN